MSLKPGPKEAPPSPGSESKSPKIFAEAGTGGAAPEAGTLQMLRASVVGGRLDRLFFWGLCCLAICLFLSSAFGLVQAASRDVVTNVSFVLRETFEFPAMFFCFLNRENPPATEPDMTFALMDGSAAKPFTMVSGVQCTSGVVRVVYGSDGSLETKECVALDTTYTSDAAKAISSYLKKAGPADTATTVRRWDCSVMNTDGGQTAARGSNTRIIIEGESTPDAHANNLIVVGFFDAKLPLADILSKNFNMRFLSIYNRIAEVSFTMDQVTDVSDTYSLNPQAIKGNEAYMEKVYFSSLSQALLAIEHGTDGNAGTKHSIWQFSVGSFLGRDLLIRKKAFSELWAEIGGCWTSSLMLIGIFFTRRSLSGAKGNTLQAHVPRFHGESSKRAMLGELRAYVGTPLELKLEP